MRELLHVYVDEYGDPNLDLTKAGVSKSYIVAAVCVRAPILNDARIQAEAIRKKFFQTGEMKSSTVGSKDGKRIALLKKFASLGVFVVAFCADKERVVPESGLRFKKSFMKHFARKMYERLNHSEQGLIVTMDQHGTPEFQEEFREYLKEHFPVDLFSTSTSTFEFADSKDEVLLQVADVYAGSLARLYDREKKSDRQDELLQTIRPCVSVTFWPSGREETSEPIISSMGDDVDEKIRRYCMGQVTSYIEMNRESPDTEELARLEFLNILLSHQAWGVGGKFLSTKLVLGEVNKRFNERMSVHKFRSSVVAKLRDSDVIISSSPRGYKIPVSYADIRDFAAFANTIVPPMISRVEKAWRGVREATLGKADVLAEDEFSQLKVLVAAQHKV